MNKHKDRPYVGTNRAGGNEINKDMFSLIVTTFYVIVAILIPTIVLLDAILDAIKQL